jgi:hypothetical protein
METTDQYRARKREFEKALGREIRDETWDFLAEEFYPEELTLQAFFEKCAIAAESFERGFGRGWDECRMHYPDDV